MLVAYRFLLGSFGLRGYIFILIIYVSDRSVIPLFSPWFETLLFFRLGKSIKERAELIFRLVRDEWLYIKLGKDTHLLALRDPSFEFIPCRLGQQIEFTLFNLPFPNT